MWLRCARSTPIVARMRSYLRSMSASNSRSASAGQVSQPLAAISLSSWPGAPAGIAERHQRLARPAPGRNGAQYVDRRRQADLLRDRHRRLHREIVRMQDEAAAPVDRTAIAHDEIARLRRQPDRLLLVEDAELDEQVGKAHLLGLVDDQAHRAFLAMGADIDHGARETVVLHAGHGNEELVVEEAARRLLPLSPQKVHCGKVTRFRQAGKMALDQIAPTPAGPDQLRSSRRNDAAAALRSRLTAAGIGDTDRPC